MASADDKLAARVLRFCAEAYKEAYPPGNAYKGILNRKADELDPPPPPQSKLDYIMQRILGAYEYAPTRRFTSTVDIGDIREILKQEGIE